MLVEVPRLPPDKAAAIKSEAVTDSFQAALRRDLASAPVVACGPLLGGWSKRAIDVALVVVSAPIWLLVLGLAALLAKLRHTAPALVAQERIGYAGRAFKMYSMRLSPPSATVTRLHPDAPANDLSAVAPRAEETQAKWRRALERLPQLFNVLRGEMALVGPTPLSSDELAALRVGRSYYLSARPGVIGVSAVADRDEEEAVQYKMYALAWSRLTDVMLLLEALRRLVNRGELWRPSALAVGRSGAAQPRQRAAGG